MPELAAFSDSYKDARRKFVEASRKAGAKLTSYQHPSERGPSGEPIFLDVSVLGPGNATRVFAVGSGTHGIEGYSGSAAQRAWLRGRPRLPKDTAVVFFHAQNPWGFAHKSRVTEENVDLNRNFVDFSRPLPANPGYEALHPLIAIRDWNEASVAGVFAGLDAYRERVGEKAFSDAFNGGQYSRPDGIFYGGARPQWSNSAFRAAVATHLGRARKVAYMDLHTGIGPWCEHIYLCFHAEGSPARERARAWWGERAVNLQGVTHKKLATYSGTIIDAVTEMLPAAEVTSIVVEFGTRPRHEMQRASMAQRWMRFEGPRDPVLAAKVRREYEAAFYPVEPEWRQAVLGQSREFLDRGVRGISLS
ncbi:MAG TPA: M14 family metallopeptidase [Burkholderiales bacterium]|nr:M14 family metallopeptidase [Burkholderiales bacterium]